MSAKGVAFVGFGLVAATLVPLALAVLYFGEIPAFLVDGRGTEAVVKMIYWSDLSRDVGLGGTLVTMSGFFGMLYWNARRSWRMPATVLFAGGLHVVNNIVEARELKRLHGLEMELFPYAMHLGMALCMLLTLIPAGAQRTPAKWPVWAWIIATLNVAAMMLVVVITGLCAFGFHVTVAAAFKSGDVAGDWVIDNLLTSAPLPSYYSLYIQVTILFQMVTLFRMPHRSRVLFQCMLAFCIIYLNSVREDAYCRAATGLPMPMLNWIIHIVEAVIFVSAILLPNPPVKKEVKLG